MWTLPKTEHRVYPRNPLTAVVCQLRFQPILKVTEQVSSFQEHVRVGTNFRGYRAMEVQQIQVPIGDARGASLTREPQHQFIADDHATLALTPTSITLDFRKHHARDRIFSDAAVTVAALQAAYAPVHPVRLGLRYVNHIDRMAIGSFLGRDVSWEALIDPDFFRPPLKLVDMQETLFHTEVSSSLPRGSLTLRFGLVPHATTTMFLLDLDRAVGGPIRLDEVQSLLEEFADDIYAVFNSACGPALREWLEG
jgi:uncharacterized protein (TIGR04255 family)